MSATQTPTETHFGRHPETDSPEHGRFFSIRKQGLFSLRRDGSLHVKRLEHGWRRVQPPAAPNELAIRIERFTTWSATGQPWQRIVEDIPTLDDLEQQLREDGAVETPTGHCVEPDGTGPDGVPSWLRVFRMI